MLAALAWTFASLLIVLLVAGRLLEDRFWLPTTLNALRVYWLTPVWALLAFALLMGRRRLAILASLGAALWLWLFGPLWLPNLDRPDVDGPALTVMSYNLLVFNQDVDSVVQSILEADADLVGFQELSPSMAQALDDRLADVYPYRVLDVENGALSRYQLRRVAQTLPGVWGEPSPPQVYRVSVAGRELTWIDAHQFSPITLGGGYAARALLTERRRQSRTIADYARHEIDVAGRPVLLTTDLNATDQSAVHAIISEVLRDAWREAGFGLGFSWRYEGQHWTGWVANIDHIFCSPDQLWAEDARLGRWDGQSDHRPVVARLRWRR